MPTKKNRAAYHREWRRLRKMSKGPRVCAWEGCTTVLNSYNLNKCCHLHNIDYVIKHGVMVREYMEDAV